MKTKTISSLILTILLCLTVSNAFALRLVWTHDTSDCNTKGNCPTGYNVYHKTGTAPEQKIQLGVQLQYVLDSFQFVSGQTTVFTVTAFNTIGESGRSPSVSYTPTALPGSPTDVFISNWRLSWTAPACTAAANNCPTKYNVYYQQLPDGIVRNVDVGNALYYDLTQLSLTNCYQYRFWVRAVNAAGEGPISSNSIDYCMPCQPSVPGTLAIE